MNLRQGDADGALAALTTASEAAEPLALGALLEGRPLRAWMEEGDGGQAAQMTPVSPTVPLRHGAPAPSTPIPVFVGMVCFVLYRVW